MVEVPTEDGIILFGIGTVSYTHLKELFCRFRFANVAAKIRTFILNLQIISELFF